MTKNYEWYVKTDTSKYAGKWIAIVNQRVVASGKNVKEVLVKAKKKYPKQIPTIAKVPRDETLVLNTKSPPAPRLRRAGEIRNSKQIQSTNDRNHCLPRRQAGDWQAKHCLEHLNFEFRYCLGFSASNLGFY